MNPLPDSEQFKNHRTKTAIDNMNTTNNIIPDEERIFCVKAAKNFVYVEVETAKAWTDWFHLCADALNGRPYHGSNAWIFDRNLAFLNKTHPDLRGKKDPLLFAVRTMCHHAFLGDNDMRRKFLEKFIDWGTVYHNSITCAELRDRVKITETESHDVNHFIRELYLAHEFQVFPRILHIQPNRESVIEYSQLPSKRLSIRTGLKSVLTMPPGDHPEYVWVAMSEHGNILYYTEQISSIIMTDIRNWMRGKK